MLFVTNFWQDVKLHVGEAREVELASEVFFKPALDCGARIVRHADTIESVHDILRQLLTARPTALLLQQEMVDEEKMIQQTSVGRQLEENLEKRLKRTEEKYRDLKQEIEGLKLDAARHEKRARARWQSTSAQVNLEVIQKELTTLRARLGDEEQRHMEKMEDVIRDMNVREGHILRRLQDRVRGLEEKIGDIEATRRAGDQGLWARFKSMLGFR